MKETLTQYKTVFLMTMNFMLGVCLFTTVQFNQDLIFDGLYHKIIPLFGVNIPVGFISGILINAILAFLIVMVLSIDVVAYKKGIDAIPMKQKEEKPNVI